MFPFRVRLSLPPAASLTVVLLLGMLLPCSAVFAQRVSPVSFTVAVNPAIARPGETVLVTVTATIKPPYHMYSIVPVPPPGPQQTVLSVSGPGLVPAGNVTESAPKIENDPNFGKPVGFHEATATFSQALTVPENAKTAAASVPLTVSVRFMACDDHACLPPKTVMVDASPLGIEAGPVRAPYHGVPESPSHDAAAPSGNASAASVLDATDTSAGQGSLLSFIVTAFAAGLLALVTPCVFPMVPVTLAFFTKQATGKPGGIVRLAATYSLGIVLAFTTIGAVLAATVGAAGANRIAANPWVNVVFALLFVMFGLALLEIVELRPPAGLQKLTVARPNAGSTVGVLFMGITFVIAAFTCTAPFIGTILVAASTASSGAQWLRPIVGMTAFSAALALPFFLLSLFPGLLARMPKSGAWLSTVKGTMGFLEIAAALKFLSNADLVWQGKLITQPVFLALWMALAVAAAFYLLGTLRIGWSSPEGKPTAARTLWASVFFGFAAYCLWGLTGRPLQADMVAFLPPQGYGYSVAGTSDDVAARNELPFLDTLEKGLAQAKAENKPVFIDFTGYTCTNCRWMEKNIFPTPAVKGELEKFVRVRLYTDGGRDGDKNQQYQEKTFGDVALPLYAILTPDGKPVVKSAGITRDAGKYAALLRQGREKQAMVSIVR